MSSNNLWWSFDPDDGSFAALPAGPALLPALGVFAIIAAVQAFRGRNQSAEKILGHGFVSSDYYREAKSRQDALIQKRVDHAMGEGEGLTLAEHNELRTLQHPAWNNGNRWSF